MTDETSQDILDRVVADVGGAFAAGLAYIGDRLGLFRLIAQGPGGSSEEIAEAGFSGFVELEIPSRMQQFYLLSNEGAA